MTDHLTGLLREAARDRPELALGVSGDLRPLADLLAAAERRAAVLLDRGLQPGDRVALVAPSSTDYLVHVIAGILAGLPTALVNPTYPTELLASMVDDIDPAAVVVGAGVDPAIAGGRGWGDVTGALADSGASSDRSVAPRELPGAAAGRLDTALFLHTSGTTGQPKFCALSHEYLLRLGARFAQELGLSAADRVLAPLPMFHINPLGYGFFGGLAARADVVSVAAFSASGFWPLVRRERITALVLHAPPVEILKRATTASDAEGHRVRTMFYADGDFMRTFGIGRATSGYGSTESAGLSHLRTWTSGDELPRDASRRAGRGRDDVEWRLDESGGLLVRGTAPGVLFSGYWRDGAVRPALDEDGWFETGDLGRLDEDGGLVFLERRAESIRVKGEFVPIPFVEERLGSIAALDDLAIWRRRGDLVDDEVTLYAVCDALPVDEIRAVAAELPAFMRPVAVARIERMPRDAAAGKVQRRLLDGADVLEWVEL
ncbi:class I adenylate-forming enzyme family protein [Microbacterium sp. X-17]|uniref:class I adenylate-forming enzyme family protein n=1 Tax=Microbacterium sp. X-17 TaxID=3144404 RepID=UPI0031F57837